MSALKISASKRPNSVIIAEMFSICIVVRCSSDFFYPKPNRRVEMNKTLETIRGSWITRDREAAEANRNILRKSIDQIPAELSERFVSIVEWAHRMEVSSDMLLDVSVKYEEAQINEILFLEAQIKKLLQGIQQIKDIDSIKTLRQIARDTIDLIGDHKLKQEQARLAGELATRGRAISSN
jgi:hypothetical protein